MGNNFAMSPAEPLITIFTAPKPFTNPHINQIQRNAINSWKQLSADVCVLLIGDEQGMAEYTHEAAVLQLPDVARNAQGTPLVSSIFELARQNSTSPLLAYVNADILLTSEIVHLARQVMSQCAAFLIVGQRWDLEVREAMDFSLGWEERLLDRVRKEGRIHPPAGSDYFIFPRSCYTELPEFAIGRAGWDNWMFYHARCEGWPVIDVSTSVTVIHQEHDYSHLPGGRPHYKMPESFENIRLAGGRRTIFTLLDANFTFKDREVQPLPMQGRRLLRSLETFPLLKWKSSFLAEVSFTIFHPIKALGEWRGRIMYLLRKARHQNA